MHYNPFDLAWLYHFDFGHLFFGSQSDCDVLLISKYPPRGHLYLTIDTFPPQVWLAEWEHMDSIDASEVTQLGHCKSLGLGCLVQSIF